MVCFLRVGGDSAWYILFLFFPIFLPTLLPVLEWASSQQQETAGAPVCKNKYQEQSQILSTCHFQLGVTCLHWVEMWLCCKLWVLPVCCLSGPHNTPTSYPNCTFHNPLEERYPSLLRVSIAGLHRQTGCEEDLSVSLLWDRQVKVELISLHLKVDKQSFW